MSLTILNPRHRRSPRNLTLNDIYPDWINGGGVFSKLSNIAMPWAVDKAPALDIAYHSRSGSKFVAPIAYNFLDEDGEMSTEGYNKINGAIRALYLQKWYHLWDLYASNYNPLENYNVTEEHHEEVSDSKEQSSTRTPNLTERKHGDDDTSTSVTESSSIQHGLKVTDSGSDSASFVNGHVIRDSGSDVSSTDSELTVTDSGSDVTSMVNGHVITDSGTDTTTTTYGKVTTSEGEPTSSSINKVMAFDGQDFANVSQTDNSSVTDNVETLSGSDTNALLHGKTETHSGTDQNTTQYGKAQTSAGTDEVTTQYGKTETHSGTDQSSTTYGKVQTNSGTDTQAGTKSDATERDIDITTTQTGTETNSGTESFSHESDFSLTKVGNVYKSPAELMSDDRDFWQEEYFNIVFADIDNFMTLAIFSDKEINTKIY